MSTPQRLRPHHILHVACAVAISLAAGSAAASDPVAESFDRMLTHTPHHGPTVTAAHAATDPLHAAMVLPLREGQPLGRHDQPFSGATVARSAANKPVR